MKIIMDFRKYDNAVAGVEVMVYNLCKYLGGKGHKIVLVCRSNKVNEIKKIFSKVKNLKIIPLPVKSHSMGIMNLIMDSFYIQNIALKEKADLIHFTYNWSFPFRKKVPCILTIHDLVPFSIRDGMPFFRYKFLYKPGIRLAVKLNDLITTVSNYSKKDIVEKTGINKNKIKVIYNGFQDFKKIKNHSKLRRWKKKIGKEYIMFVGGFKERKNVSRLIMAFARFVKEGYNGKLVLTNRFSGVKYYIKKFKEYNDVAKSEGVLNKVVFTDFLPEEILGGLMAKANFTLYTSLFEGFGIPILESMNLGVPVITSNVTSMLEVAEDGALIVDPYSVEDIYKSMMILWKNKKVRDRLIKRGREIVKKYSWEKAGKQYVTSYKKLVK